MAKALRVMLVVLLVVVVGSAATVVTTSFKYKKSEAVSLQMPVESESEVSQRPVEEFDVESEEAEPTVDVELEVDDEESTGSAWQDSIVENETEIIQEAAAQLRILIDPNIKQSLTETMDSKARFVNGILRVDGYAHLDKYKFKFNYWTVDGVLIYLKVADEVYIDTTKEYYQTIFDYAEESED